jgi:hypothetical protein
MEVCRAIVMDGQDAVLVESVLVPMFDLLNQGWPRLIVYRPMTVPRKPAFETPEKKAKKEKDKELGDKKPLNSHRQISWKD